MIRPVYFLLLETSPNPLFSLPLQNSADLIHVKKNTELQIHASNFDQKNVILKDHILSLII